MEEKDLTCQLDMVNVVRREMRMRKSIRLARAVAEDFHEHYGSKATAEESKNKKGNPGIFIRADIYNVGGHIFLRESEALSCSEILSKAFVRYWSRNSSCKVISQDFGLIEMMEILLNDKCSMPRTMEVYEKLAISVKFGI